MSLGRVLVLGTAVAGAFIVMKPEARQKVKKLVALQLHKLGNSLDPQGPPPMWTDEDTEEVAAPASPAQPQELADPLEEDPNDSEDRTIHGFKVKR